MSHETQNSSPTNPKLSEALRAAKNTAADSTDIAMGLYETERMRLAMLRDELSSLIEEVPLDVNIFDFAISSGLQQRLWIDSLSYIVMSRDKRIYRFLKDTQNGRIIITESPDIKHVARHVTSYVAGRIVERERMMEQGPFLFYRDLHLSNSADNATTEQRAEYPAKKSTHCSIFFILSITLLAGIVLGLLIAFWFISYEIWQSFMDMEF